MIAKVESACLMGMEAARVHVEVSLARGLPSFAIVGLPDASVREARDRVVAAIRNSGFEFPSKRVTVNLAPAELKKEGPSFDLAIAVGILMASEAITPSAWPQGLWLGELALDGTLRPIRGALPLVRSLSQRGSRCFILPSGNVPEVSVLDKTEVYAFNRLTDVVQWLQGEAHVQPVAQTYTWQPKESAAEVDLSDIKGQRVARRALEIAAAGNHNLLLIGCPGTGKSMLAQAMPSLMPPWTLEEALEATQVHSLTASTPLEGLLRARSVRSPHHSASPVALIGGGDVPMPGEISLAHRGILFLDELPEFRRDALEALRQPLESGVIHIHRARGRATFPARFLLIAAMNPCPCGNRGHPKKECSCPPQRVQKYLSKISAPLLDRIDLHVEMSVLKVEELLGSGPEPESSAAVRERVIKARHVQHQRYASESPDMRSNAQLRGRNLKRHCALDDPGHELLGAAVNKLGLSARAFDRILRVARTIADIDGKSSLQAPHIAEAIHYRALDRPVSHA